MGIFTPWSLLSYFQTFLAACYTYWHNQGGKRLHVWGFAPSNGERFALRVYEMK